MPKRTPVKRTPIVLEKKGWVEAQKLRVLGIDPGFASMGLAVLEKGLGPAKILEAMTVKTQKGSKKDLRGMRISSDDQRRLREIHNALCDVTARFEPHALAYEVYSPHGPQGGSAWKSCRAEGMVQCFALERSMLLLPYIPHDLKMGVTGKLSASKTDVQWSLTEKFPAFEGFMRKMNKGLREHAADAVGYAYLAFEEIANLRKQLGIL